MVEITQPSPINAAFGALLRSCKADFVSVTADSTWLMQHGAASVGTAGWPGWPAVTEGFHDSAGDDAVIEMFVASPSQVTATSDNEPFVSNWQPLAAWMNATVRTALADVGVELAGDAYVTASLTPVDLLEGIAHLDDDQFVPADSVSIVAILGQQAGPRIATAPVRHPTLRPMAPVTFEDPVLRAFAASEIDHCACGADELVVFPQFGQLHAGPAPEHLVGSGLARQLLVMRAAVVPGNHS